MSILKFTKNLALLILTVAGMTACNDIEGTLKATENLMLSKGKKSISIPVGTYETKLDADDKEVEVKIKVGSDSEKFKFAVPKDSLKGNTFNIPADQTGQAYGLQGTRDITESTTGPHQDWESCSYDEWYTRCATDREGRTQCWNERVTRWGQRWVEYMERETTYTVNANLINTSGSTAATFDGTRTMFERLYRNQGYCR